MRPSSVSVHLPSMSLHRLSVAVYLPPASMFLLPVPAYLPPASASLQAGIPYLNSPKVSILYLMPPEQVPELIRNSDWKNRLPTCCLRSLPHYCYYPQPAAHRSAPASPSSLPHFPPRIHPYPQMQLHRPQRGRLPGCSSQPLKPFLYSLYPFCFPYSHQNASYRFLLTLVCTVQISLPLKRSARGHLWIEQKCLCILTVVFIRMGIVPVNPAHLVYCKRNHKFNHNCVVFLISA